MTFAQRMWKMKNPAGASVYFHEHVITMVLVCFSQVQSSSPTTFVRVFDSLGSSPGQFGWYADVLKPCDRANFFRGIADTTFQRNPNQFSKHKRIAANVKDPRTIEFRVFVLRSEDTSRQRAAWKDMNTKKSSTLQRRAGSSRT